MGSKRKLFVVSAPSGAGKTTLCEKLIEKDDDIVRSVSLTTRPMRRGERNGSDYFFVSREEFERRIKRKEFLEFAQVFGNYYGTLRVFVEKTLREDKDVLLNIDVQGAMQIRKNFREHCVLIFVLPPSLKDLEKRLTKRKTDTKAQIRKRLRVARRELGFLKYYDFQVINDNIKDAAERLAAVVIAERSKVSKQRQNGSM